MENIINLKLLSNPINWVIIFLTLYFVALLVQMIYTASTTGQTPIPLPNI